MPEDTRDIWKRSKTNATAHWCLMSGDEKTNNASLICPKSIDNKYKIRVLTMSFSDGTITNCTVRLKLDKVKVAFKCTH